MGDALVWCNTIKILYMSPIMPCFLAHDGRTLIAGVHELYLVYERAIFLTLTFVQKTVENLEEKKIRERVKVNDYFCLSFGPSNVKLHFGATAKQLLP